MRKTLFMMYRGGESARGSNESAIGLSCPASAKVLANAATGVCNVILDLSREAGSRTASAACRVQQSCWQPAAADMPDMEQLGPMLPIAMGQPGTQAGAAPAAQFRLERTGCAARRAITSRTTVLSRCFISRSLK